MDATLFNPRYASANVEKLRLLIKRQMRGHSCQGLKILSISKKSNRSKQKTVSCNCADRSRKKPAPYQVARSPTIVVFLLLLELVSK